MRLDGELKESESMDSSVVLGKEKEGALKARERRREERRAAKVAREPGVYVCAARGCGVEGKGKAALRACGGPCRNKAGARARYCSEACQRLVSERLQCWAGAFLNLVAS